MQAVHPVRLATAILAVAALSVAVVLATSNASAKVHHRGGNATVEMKFDGKHAPFFKSDATVKEGSKLKIINKSDPMEIGPHTFSVATREADPGGQDQQAQVRPLQAQGLRERAARRTRSGRRPSSPSASRTSTMARPVGTRNSATARRRATPGSPERRTTRPSRKVKAKAGDEALLLLPGAPGDASGRSRSSSRRSPYIRGKRRAAVSPPPLPHRCRDGRGRAGIAGLAAPGRGGPWLAGRSLGAASSRGRGCRSRAS